MWKRLFSGHEQKKYNLNQKKYKTRKRIFNSYKLFLYSNLARVFLFAVISIPPAAPLANFLPDETKVFYSFKCILGTNCKCCTNNYNDYHKTIVSCTCYQVI